MIKTVVICNNHFYNKYTVVDVLLQYLATRGFHKTLLMEEVLLRYFSDELTDRKKIHEEEMKELSKSVFITCKQTH